MWRWAWAIIASGLWAYAATAARAEPSAALDTALSVQPDDNGCVTERALRARVRRWLKPGTLRAGITVAVRAASQPISFTVEREGRAVAERSLKLLPAACADRLDAVALAVALAIEHASGTASIEAAPDATPNASAAAADAPGGETGKTAQVPEAATEQTRDAKPTPESIKAAADKVATVAPLKAEADVATATPPGSGGHMARAWRLQAGGAYLLGALPDAAGVISAGLERVVAPHLDVGLAGLVAPGTQTTLGAGSAQTQAYGVRVLACANSQLGDLSLEGCAGGAGAVALATGKSFASNPTASMAWLAGLVRAGVRFPAESVLSVRLAVDGLGNLVRPELRADEGAVQQTATGSAFGAAGSIELLFALP